MVGSEPSRGKRLLGHRDGVVSGGHGLADGVGQRRRAESRAAAWAWLTAAPGASAIARSAPAPAAARAEHRHRQRVVIAGSSGRRRCREPGQQRGHLRGSSGRRRGGRGCARRPRRPGRGLGHRTQRSLHRRGSGIGGVHCERRPGDGLGPTASGTQRQRSPTAAWPASSASGARPGTAAAPDVAGHGQHQPEAPLTSPRSAVSAHPAEPLVGTRQTATSARGRRRAASSASS